MKVKFSEILSSITFYFHDCRTPFALFLPLQSFCVFFLVAVTAVFVEVDVVVVAV